jgi:hypothetical protein
MVGVRTQLTIVMSLGLEKEICLQYAFAGIAIIVMVVTTLLGFSRYMK